MAPTAGSAISFTLNSEGLEKKQAKEFALKDGVVVRIGRSPVADFVIEHRGVSQYHAELRLLPDGKNPARLCIRDVSSNGTGIKRPGADEAVNLPKNGDEPVVDGAQLLVPMRLKENHLGRAWITVNLHGFVDGGKADNSVKEPSSKNSKGKKSRRHKKSPSEAAAADNSPAKDGSGSEQADAEAARKQFVELLLQTREISGSTTYAEAEKLLSSDPAWSGCKAQTRKECFTIFVDHLGDTSGKKKDKKKKDKDKDKAKKKDKEKGAKEKGSPAEGGKRNGKKKRRSVSREGGGSASRSPSRTGKRRRRHRSGSP